MIIRRVARTMLSAIFVYGGINAIRNAEGHAQAVKPWLDKTVGQQANNLPDGVPTEPITLVRLDAGVKLGAGAMLALGKFPRLASMALVGSLVPTTLANHAYWEFQDEGQRQMQQVQFFKNVSLVGGLVLFGTEPGAKQSGRRAKKTADKASKPSQLTGSNVPGSDRAARKSRDAAKQAAKLKEPARAAKKRTKKAVKR